jgi:hypothetical protein
MRRFIRSGDLFEDLRRSLDCEFISDTIRTPFRYEACRMLTSAVLTGYPLEQWIDMVKYFSFGNAALIKSEEDAKKFFGKYLNEL